MGKDKHEEQSRNPRRARRSMGKSSDYASADATLVLQAITLVAKHGGALRLGYTSDGGAYAIGVYGDGDPYTEYV